MDNDNQVEESIWEAIQQRLDLTDGELQFLKTKPFAHKMLRTKTINHILQTNIIFEVVKAHNCNIGHKVGDKFFFNKVKYKTGFLYSLLFLPNLFISNCAFSI